jgi:hypothetical protein
MAGGGWSAVAGGGGGDSTHGERIWNSVRQQKVKRGLVEASETRGTTALVYCLIDSSLYTGTVKRWWSTPRLV